MATHHYSRISCDQCGRRSLTTTDLGHAYIARLRQGGWRLSRCVADDRQWHAHCRVCVKIGAVPGCVAECRALAPHQLLDLWWTVDGQDVEQVVRRWNRQVGVNSAADYLFGRDWPRPGQVPRSRIEPAESRVEILSAAYAQQGHACVSIRRAGSIHTVALRDVVPLAVLRPPGEVGDPAQSITTAVTGDA